MRRLGFAALGLLALAAAPAPLRAQTIPSPYSYLERAQSIHLFAGSVSTGAGEYGLTPHSSAIFGVRYEGRFTGPISGIVEVSAMPSRRDILQRSQLSGDTTLTRLGDTGDLVASAEAGFRFSLTGPRTWHSIQPFVSLTAGIVRDFSSRTADEKELPADQLVSVGPSFAVGPAAGIDWFLTDRFSLRIEAKDHLWRRSIPAGISRTKSKQSEWTNNVGVTLGAALHF